MALDAGFTDVRATSSTWTCADPESCTWWADLWADRTTISPLAEQAVAYNIAQPAELEDIAAAWRAWAQESSAFFLVPHGEVLARR